MGPTWAFGQETAVHALRLMGSGLFDAHPKLKIILGHMGEGLPYSMWRVDHRNGWVKAPPKHKAKKKICDYFNANFFLTTSGNFRTQTLIDSILEIGADRILFSVDWPFENVDHASDWFNSASISENDRLKIGRRNAIDLFKLDLGQSVVAEHEHPSSRGISGLTTHEHHLGRGTTMSTQVIDLHEELAEAKVGKFHWRLGAMMGLLTLFDGYDTFNPAYVIHYVAKPWGLQAGQAGLLISSGLVGFLIGAAIHGIIADRLGRRGTLLGGLWITSIFTLLTATSADSFLSFCILRILTGIGLGVLLPLATTYINELAPRRVANTFALWGVALGWALGGTLAGVAGVFATPVFGWTSLYWIGSLSFLLLPFMHFMLPESPKFLALQGRTDEIRDMLSKLRPERAAVYKSAEIAVEQSEKPVNSVAVLLQPKYRRTTFAIWASAFLSLFCIFGLSGWIPTVMMQRGETFAASFGFGALMQIMSFVGALVLGHLVDKSGSSRGLIATWWAIGGVAVLSLVVLNDHIVNITSVAAAGFFIIGAQFVLNNFTAASYETGVRATAVGMELGVARVGAILGPFVAGALQQIYQSPTPMFLSIGISAIAAGGIILLARRPAGVPASSLEETAGLRKVAQPAS